MSEENELVDMVATRRFAMKGESVKPGDKFKCPANNEVDGVPSARWFESTKKAVRADNKELLKRVQAENEQVNQATGGRDVSGNADPDAA